MKKEFFKSKIILVVTVLTCFKKSEFYKNVLRVEEGGRGTKNYFRNHVPQVKMLIQTLLKI